jgi:hypothetical protein
MIRQIRRKVKLVGLTPIMFDRYSGNNKETLHVSDKCYKDNEGCLVLPSVNILSFLSAQNTESATQRVVGRGYKEVCKSALSYIQIYPIEIPFLREGRKIKADDDNLKINVSVAKIMKGKLAIPNPKERPLLETPWYLEFELTLQETPELNENLLKKIFEIGGNAIGLGTFRGVYGKFKVDLWEEVD